MRDETSWGHQGWGKPKSGLVKRILNKPGVSKEGQIVLICDQDWIHPHAYVYSHKIWDRPTGFAEGINEVRMVIGKLDDMIIGEGDKQVKKIFTKRPAITWDDYFSGHTIFMTVRWDRLPKGVSAQYFHKKPNDPDNSEVKCAHYNEPIVMVTNKEDPETQKKCQKVHVSFQSTSSFSI
eukprot:12940326-Ditylum_brightwellii.AAC.1